MYDAWIVRMFWLRDRQKRTLNQLHYVHFLKSKEVSFRHTFLAFSANHTAIKTTSAIPWCGNYMQRHKHRGYLLIVKQEFRQAKMTCAHFLSSLIRKTGGGALVLDINCKQNKKSHWSLFKRLDLVQPPSPPPRVYWRENIFLTL